MQAVQITQYGGAEVLTPAEVDLPVAGPGQAVVEIAATGVNFIDVYHRQGRYPTPLPFVPGVEAAGRSPRWGRTSPRCRSASGSAGSWRPGRTRRPRLCPWTGWCRCPRGVRRDRRGGAAAGHDRAFPDPRRAPGAGR
ncbi:alcohol dehydrogenase catalytic domain-containing protein [Catellatospora coxensis]